MYRAGLSGWVAGAILIWFVWLLVPPAGMICAGILAVDRLIWLAIRTFVFAQQRQQKFQYLDKLEQGLRRGSQGFAVMTLAALAFFVVHGWLSGWAVIAGALPAWIAKPAPEWLAFGCLALFVSAGGRFIAGAAVSAGARDGMRWQMAALRLAVGVAAFVYLMRADVLARYGATPAGLVACAAAFSVAIWLGLVGFMRLLLLSWPRGWALPLVNTFIENDEFTWGDARPRRWWQFWKGPTP